MILRKERYTSETQHLHRDALLRLGKDQHHAVSHQADPAAGQKRY